MVYLVILFLAAAIGAVLFLLEIKCVIEYARNDVDDNIVIAFYTMKGVFKYKYEIPLIDVGRSNVKFRLVREKGKKDKVTGVEKREA